MFTMFLRRWRPLGWARSRQPSLHSVGRRPRFVPRLETLEGRLAPAVFTVTNTADSGAGSLRQAIQSADTTQAPSTIQFNIADSGVQIIQPASFLPTIRNIFNQGITIDGTTEKGYSGSPIIVLDGSKVSQAEGPEDGLDLAGSACTIKGLAIVNFSGSGVAIAQPTATGNTVELNYIGTSDGVTASGNGLTGVEIAGGASNNTIAGNVISGNAYDGIQILSSGTTGNQVLDNLIGTSADAGHPLGNGGNGVEIGDAASNNLVGSAGAGNLIAFNHSAGVVVSEIIVPDIPLGNTISQNAIFANKALGIDLGGDGVTANTPGGPHNGPNHLQNYPVLTPYTTPGTVSGSLNSAPNSTFHLEFFANPAPDPSGHGQGQDYLGTEKVTTDAGGNASFTFSYAPIAGAPFLSATATDPAGDTSEFSATVDGGLTATDQVLAAREGAGFSGVLASFTDADPAATAASFTANIAWGDGATTPGTVVPGAGDSFAVTASHTYQQEAGILPVTVTVKDVSGNTEVIATSLMSVADAPLTVSTSPVSAVEGAAFSGQVGTFFDANPSATVSDYTITITWGDGSSSAGTVTSLGSGLFAVSGTHTYAGAGTYGLSLWVQDVGGATAVGSGYATVVQAPLQAAGKRLKVTPGTPFSGVLATFTDGNPSAVAANFTAMITWDNGTAGFGTITGTGPGGTGPFTVSGAHTFGRFSTVHTVSITIFNRGSAALTVTDTVTDPPAPAGGHHPRHHHRRPAV
jgi:parallel beta-helix repeat protein